MTEHERYEVFLRLSDAEDDRCVYTVEHWFVDRPEDETVRALLEEAKRAYLTLYPDLEPNDFSVEVRRLRPRDVGRDARSV